MKLKTLIVTVSVLGALSAAVFLLRRPSAPAVADERVGQPLITTAVIEKTAKIRLSDQGKTVTLSRQADASWQVDEYHALPADFQKLSEFVGSLTEAKLSRFISARPEVTARLEFKDTRIELLDATGSALAAVTLGKNAETGGRYVRFAEEPRAYLASLMVWLDAEAKNWADASLPTPKAEEIASIEVAFDGGATATLTRAKAGEAWTSPQLPAGRAFDADKIDALLSTLTQMRFTDTTAPDDAAAVAASAHGRRYLLKTFDGQSHTVTLARKPEEKKLKIPAATGAAVPDFTKNSPLAADGTVKPVEPAAPSAPEFETIPAGPVFVSIAASDEKASINARMARRAFQVAEYTFTSLPANLEALLSPAPAPAPSAPAESSGK